MLRVEEKYDAITYNSFFFLMTDNIVRGFQRIILQYEEKIF